MLRGPQTVNELKDRTNRIHEFAGETEVADTLQRLMQREPRHSKIAWSAWRRKWQRLRIRFRKSSASSPASVVSLNNALLLDRVPV